MIAAEGMLRQCKSLPELQFLWQKKREERVSLFFWLTMAHNYSQLNGVLHTSKTLANH